MSVTEIEQRLTAHIAGLLGLAVDESIFRGKLPAAKLDAAAVIIENTAKGNTPGMPRFQVQILARFAGRDTAVDFCGKLDKAFPAIEAPFYILKSSKPGVYSTTHKGKDVCGVSITLDVRLTASLKKDSNQQ